MSTGVVYIFYIIMYIYEALSGFNKKHARFFPN